jgi:Zn-dependent protease
MTDALYQISIWLLPVLIAITFHEAAHGYVAWRLGDDTAKRLGRVTFQPLKHVDLYGTIIVPGLLLLLRAPFLFGWAKPVPVDFMNLRNPRRDMILVAAAGPGINLSLALVSAALIHLIPYVPPFTALWLKENLYNSIVINLVLAVFNMMPIPPLDGGRVAVGLLPRPLARGLARLERIGLLIVIFLVFVIPWVGRELGVNLNILAWIVGVPVEFLFDLVFRLTGHA